MKSCFAGWNPNKFGWNLQPSASDEIKSASLNPAQAGFHHVRIPLAVSCVIRRLRPTNSKFHPRSGFIPTKADLVEKSTCLRKCFFLVGMTGFEPATSCSQSTRATNCATSRLNIKFWFWGSNPGRIWSRLRALSHRRSDGYQMLFDTARLLCFFRSLLYYSKSIYKSQEKKSKSCYTLYKRLWAVFLRRGVFFDGNIF